MSIQLMSAVFERGPDNSSERFVLLALANYADAVGKCWPAYGTLSKKTALSRRTVIRCVNSLVEQGYLKRRKVWNKDGEPTSNYYWIDFDKLGVICDVEPDDRHDMPTSGSDTMTLPSDTMTPPSDTVSLGGSDTMTLPSDTVSPDPSINHHSSKPSVKQQQKQPAAAKAPAAQPSAAAAQPSAAAAQSPGAGGTAKTAGSRNAAAKTTTAAADQLADANPDDNPTALVLRTYGIGINATTAPILKLDAAYVEAHLAAAKRNNLRPGLAITRMLDGDPAPKRLTVYQPDAAAHDAEPDLPWYERSDLSPELADLAARIFKRQTQEEPA